MGNDINTILKLTDAIKFLSILRTALTVGIIAFTVFRIISIFKTESVNALK